ncbi:prominin-like protein [Drosophila guanche]|uniref:prominin-like protein n=1 Tax=Drosophila guanche TaxID=7266 RepID=UPI001471782F|nr:prominin-like protein [Drosophila guanche]
MYSCGTRKDLCGGCHCLVCECISMVMAHARKSTPRRRQHHLASLPVRGFHVLELIPVLIPLTLIILSRAADGAATIKLVGAKIVKTNVTAASIVPAVGATTVNATGGATTVQASTETNYLGYPPYSREPLIFARAAGERANAKLVTADNYVGYPPYSQDPSIFARAGGEGQTNVTADAAAGNGATTLKGDEGGGAAPPIKPQNVNTVWREGYDGEGTTHEQLGQKHWPAAEYSPYVSYAPYSRDLASTSRALNVVYNFTHFLFDTFINEEPALPPGYVEATDEDQLRLGPNVHGNDWAALMNRYWSLLLFVIFLLAWIIIIPFVGVCYCCLCCCLRCKQGCTQCSARKDFRWRIGCGVCLLVMILCLISGLVTTFVANKFMDRGFAETKVTMRRANDDTCVFLRDVADHIHHLMVHNYQQLEAHLDEHLNNAHDHIFLDLADTSDGNSLSELERILDNMPKASQLMKQVDVLEKEMRFYGSQLKDGLRGMKRTVSYAAFWLCPYTDCHKFARNNRIQQIDTSACLHFDMIPNSTVYVNAIEKIMKDRLYVIPKLAIVRLNKIKEMIKKQMRLVVPPILKSIDNGRLVYLQKAVEIRDIIEGVISKIHLDTLSSTKTFDDVYEMFGPDRSAVNQIIIILILIVILILTAALICGCAGSTRRAPGRSGFCSKGMAASCLLIAIILIFCVFSFITLVGLFYLMIGLVTHEAACATKHGDDLSIIFRRLDTLMDINRYMVGNRVDSTASSRTLEVSNSIRSCHANESIFEMLIALNVFNINDLANREILIHNEESTPLFTDDLSALYILKAEEKIKLNEMLTGNLSLYHSSLYKQHLCTKFVHTHLTVLAKRLYGLSTFLAGNGVIPGSIQFKLDYQNAMQYFENMHEPLRRSINKILEKVKLIDSLILYDNHNFNKSISLILEAAEKSENFIQSKGKDFINTLAKNLTATANEVIKDYVEMVILESKKNVGHCQPLAYIYYQGIHFVCSRLVDPINAFWASILLCALLLLPILFVCHRLMCLYLRIYPIVAVTGDPVSSCPFCTGQPAPVTFCHGGQQAHCECPFGNRTDQAASAAPQKTGNQVQWADQVTGENKPKND